MRLARGSPFDAMCPVRPLSGSFQSAASASLRSTATRLRLLTNRHRPAEPSRAGWAVIRQRKRATTHRRGQSVITVARFEQTRILNSQRLRIVEPSRIRDYDDRLWRPLGYNSATQRKFSIYVSVRVAFNQRTALYTDTTPTDGRAA